MKKNLLIIPLIFTISVLFPRQNYAIDDAATVEEIKLYIGEAKAMAINNPTRIVIGNPAIADVSNVSKYELTITPIALGSTNLVIWDNFGEQSYRLKVLSEDMRDVKSRIDNILEKINLSGVYSQIEEQEGKVFLLGRVKIPQDRERLNIALGSLKDKTVDLIQVKEEETVVEIDVQVLELNRDATNTLGFTWPSSITLTEKGSPGISAAGTKWSNLFKVLNLNRAAFAWTLDALIQQGKARILSRPRLACQSGKEAELLVGGEKPIFTTEVAEAGGTGTSVEYKEYGIKLKIKPVVTENKQIKLALNVEVSDVGTAETIGSAAAPTAKAYPLNKRTVSTELFLDDKQTLAIGGLIKQKKEEDITKTAGLGDIPILGLLFRKKTTTTGGGSGERGDTELFITLTPTIVRASESPLYQEKNAQRDLEISSVLDQNIPLALSGYALVVQKRILESVVYPPEAREAGYQGVAKLSLLLSYQGKLLDTKVKSSSGYRILDDNAVSVAKGISSYPPFPTSLDLKELWVDVPIAYKLD